MFLFSRCCQGLVTSQCNVSNILLPCPGGKEEAMVSPELTVALTGAVSVTVLLSKVDLYRRASATCQILYWPVQEISGLME